MKRRTVDVGEWSYENRWGWPGGVRLEFGPWWMRLWWIVIKGGEPHRIITGEPCVAFPAKAKGARHV